jgi:Family of unknown function (DUF5675)
MKAKLQRTIFSDVQVLGTFELFDGDKKIFACKTLELPWKDNQHKISCIPKGQYKTLQRNSAKFGDHYHVLELGGGEVNGRDMILIHPGNFHTQLLGCILVGKAHADINRDGVLDVIESKNTLKALLHLAPQGFELNIAGEP